PVDELRRATQAVADGNLDVRIPDLRADEFGLLIDGFNTMVAGLREKRRVEDNFGRHVGTRVAQQILARDRGLGGVEEEVTILFVDIRDFTTRSEASAPAEVVSLLNLFLAEMVEVIEQRHGGIVNKCLGDGRMALFGGVRGRGGSLTPTPAPGPARGCSGPSPGSTTRPTPRAHPRSRSASGSTRGGRWWAASGHRGAWSTPPLATPSTWPRVWNH